MAEEKAATKAAGGLNGVEQEGEAGTIRLVVLVDRATRERVNR